MLNFLNLITALFLENTNSVKEGIGCDDVRVVSSDSGKINVCLHVCRDSTRAHECSNVAKIGENR